MSLRATTGAIDPCTEYGLALAVEDFAPVVLAGLGLLALARATDRPRTVLVGGAIVFAGGLGKATWKLLVAMEPCRRYDLLEQLLFPCLAVGFALVLWALAGRAGVLVLPVVAGAAALLTGAMWPMLVAAAVAAVALGVVAARRAARVGDRTTVLLFCLYVTGTLVLPPLAARPDQPEWLQWIEQLTNTVVQGSFLLGALRLSRRPADAPTRPVLEGATR